MMQYIGAAACLLSCLAVAGCTAFGPGRTGEKAIVSADTNAFMISHWSFPKDPAQLKQFVEDGFNTVIAVPEELPYCREHGLKAILATSVETARDFVGDPVVWGYFILDEPARKNISYKDVAARVSAFHRMDAVRPAYVNLNELDDPSEFISMVQPRILSYDYYQWWSGPDPFFPLLEKFHRAARDAGIPLIAWVEAVSVPSGPIPDDNVARIRLSVNCLLAYGVKGIQWWAWRPFNRDAGAVNERLRRLGPVMAQLRHTAAYHTPQVPEGSTALPDSARIQSPTPGLLFGIFKDGEGGDCFYVVNRAYDEPAEAVLEFANAPAGVSLFDEVSGRWVALTSEKRGRTAVVRHRLEGGAGVLLRVREEDRDDV